MRLAVCFLASLAFDATADCLSWSNHSDAIGTIVAQMRKTSRSLALKIQTIRFGNIAAAPAFAAP
jgi:hypothetical protein